MKQNDRYVTMKELPLSERPYELLRDKGAEGLTDAQLLAVFLNNGLPGETVLELSTRILAECGAMAGEDPLSCLFSLSAERLQDFKGIGRIKALQLTAVRELLCRLSKREAREKLSVHDSSSVASIYMEEMRSLRQEIVKAVFLNVRNAIVYEKTVSMGSISHSVLSPREVFLPAYEKGAGKVIILHNHPSGDPFPSEADLKLTDKMRACGDLLEIPLADHIIIGDRVYYSFRDAGIL